MEQGPGRVGSLCPGWSPRLSRTMGSGGWCGGLIREEQECKQPRRGLPEADRASQAATGLKNNQRIIRKLWEQRRILLIDPGSLINQQLA